MQTLVPMDSVCLNMVLSIRGETGVHTSVGTWAWCVQGFAGQLGAGPMPTWEKKLRLAPVSVRNQKEIALYSNPKQVCRGELVRVTGATEIFWS